MPRNIYGGGAQTNVNGLNFEGLMSIKDMISQLPGYAVNNYDLYYNDQCIGKITSTHNLYKEILKPRGIEWETIISSQLLPDEVLYIFEEEKVYIFEKKYQSGDGSVDEKLQTCDFKKKQYLKLFEPLGISVEYIYLLCSWFEKEKYRDVKEYIRSVNCYFYIDGQNIDVISLPHFENLQDVD